MDRFRGTSVLALIGMVAALALLVPAAATAATTVVNGGFETGTFEGWETANIEEFPGGGDWFVYSGETLEPFPGEEQTVRPVPQGEYAAITSQNGPGTRILYQDIAVEPGGDHNLSMLLYYDAEASIVTPPTLSAEEGPNEQYRVDLVSPSAPIDSLEPGDVLKTIFATPEGGAQHRAAKKYEVDLTPYTGQTVRLRLAEVDNQGPLYAGVDAVEIGPPPPPAAPPATTPAASNQAPATPSNAFTLGTPKLNRKSGTAKLPATVPGPGTLSFQGKALRPGTSTATAAGTVSLSVRPTKAGRGLLREHHKLRVTVSVSFTPTGGTASTQTRKVTLRLTPKKKHHKPHGKHG